VKKKKKIKAQKKISHSSYPLTHDSFTFLSPFDFPPPSVTDFPSSSSAAGGALSSWEKKKQIFSSYLQPLGEKNLPCSDFFKPSFIFPPLSTGKKNSAAASLLSHARWPRLDFLAALLFFLAQPSIVARLSRAPSCSLAVAPCRLELARLQSHPGSARFSHGRLPPITGVHLPPSFLSSAQASSSPCSPSRSSIVPRRGPSPPAEFPAREVSLAWPLFLPCSGSYPVLTILKFSLYKIKLWPAGLGHFKAQ
jgi:hypothetical protein